MPEPGLPPRLKAAAEALSAGRGATLRDGTAALTAAYKQGERSTEAIDIAAYLVARLPATFAAVSRVLAELRRRAPGFRPESLADIGSGPGTASWASAEHWPELRQFTFVDNNRAFLDLAATLARDHEALAGARTVFSHMGEQNIAADLVVAAYALAEIPERDAGATVAKLWANSRGGLVIVEPGTPAGFSRIRRAREALIALGANIAAPCTHAETCPMTGNDWCHFSVRLPRSRLHMLAKKAVVPFEDERFSYVIALRQKVETTGLRILAPPEVTKPGIKLKLCMAKGVASPMIARRDGANYKRARTCDWGDMF